MYEHDYRVGSHHYRSVGLIRIPTLSPRLWWALQVKWPLPFLHCILMNIFYEESGQFKLASIVQKNDSTYQVDTQFGKRTKIKTNNVLLEFDGDMAAFMQQAEAYRDDIDTDLLWEVSGDN